MTLLYNNGSQKFVYIGQIKPILCYKIGFMIKDKPQVIYEDETDYHSIILAKAETYDIDPSLIKAVIETESKDV